MSESEPKIPNSKRETIESKYNEDADPQQVSQKLHSFIASLDSLILATLQKPTSNQTEPTPEATLTAEASYAPFVYQNGRYYIFVSELSAHTQNLLHAIQTGATTINPFFIESEEQAKNIFARKRATVTASVSEIDRKTEQAEQILALMENKLGDTIKVLSSLNDFHLFEFTAEHAVYVEGFGAAYKLGLEWM
jgi:putative heme iron utilization protein